MAWEQKALKGPLMDGVSDLVTALGTAGAAVATVLNTAATALKLAEALYVAGVDPYAAIMKVLLDEAEKLVNDMFATGVYVLQVDPRQVIPGPLVEEVKTKITGAIDFEGYKAIARSKMIEFKWDNFGIPLMSPSQCVSYMSRSLDDKGDSLRPQFSDHATVAGFGIIVTAPDLSGFVPLAKGLAKVIDLGGLKRYLDQVMAVAQLDANEKIGFSGIPTKGGFNLEYRGSVTDTISYNAKASDVASALSALPSADGIEITVSGAFDTGFFVRFNGDPLAPLMSVAASSLKNTQGLVNITISFDEGPPKRSRQPNWYSWKLNSIDLLHKQQQQLIRLINIARGYTTVPDTVVLDLIKLLEKKVKILQTVVKEFNELINDIKNALTKSGIYVLSIPSATGGNTYIKNQLKQHSFKKLEKNGYTFGALFIGGGPSLAPVETVRNLIGA